MVLEDFLFPQEAIRYQCPSKVRCGDVRYTLYVTNLRLLAYKRGGLLFKKDEIITERLEDIRTMSYREKGILSKKGIFHIETQVKKMDFEGKANDMKTIWQKTQQCIQRPELIPKLGKIEAIAKPEAVPEEPIVLEFCPYCGAKLVSEAKFCNSCGKKLM